MIYDFPDPSSPINQGDIFINIPLIDLPDSSLSLLNEDQTINNTPWEEIAQIENDLTAIVALRLTIAIVATQQCDALRAPNITLFEIRPFRDVERKSKDTKSSAKWVSILTQHARINQKWFYLPPDKQLEFQEKMAADFLTPICLPRKALEKLIPFRKGRLNEVASQHFRERIAEFFRRYAYDEWYPLNSEEFLEYRKEHREVEPFPWQVSQDKSIKAETRPFTVQVPIQQELPGADNSIHHQIEPEKHNTKVPALPEQKGFFEHFLGIDEASKKLESILSDLTQGINQFTVQINGYSNEINKLISNPRNISKNAKKLEKIIIDSSLSINNLSNKFQNALPSYQSAVKQLETEFQGYIESFNPDSEQVRDQLIKEKQNLENLCVKAQETNKQIGSFQEIAKTLTTNKIHSKISSASQFLVNSLEQFILVTEEVESLCLKLQFTISEKLS